MEKYNKAPQAEKDAIECNPHVIFHQALDNCKPIVGLASIQKGGKSYQVGKEVQSPSLTADWVLSKHKFELLIHPGAHPSFGEPTPLPRYEVDDHRVQGEQTPTDTHVRETLSGAAGSLRKGG